MRSHNQTLLTGPSVCKSLTDVREGGESEEGRMNADATRGIRRPQRFARNVEYKLSRRFRETPPVAIAAK